MSIFACVNVCRRRGSLHKFKCFSRDLIRFVSNCLPPIHRVICYSVHRMGALAFALIKTYFRWWKKPNRHTSESIFNWNYTHEYESVFIVRNFIVVLLCCNQGCNSFVLATTNAAVIRRRQQQRRIPFCVLCVYCVHCAWIAYQKPMDFQTHFTFHQHLNTHQLRTNIGTHTNTHTHTRTTLLKCWRIWNSKWIRCRNMRYIFGSSQLIDLIPVIVDNNTSGCAHSPCQPLTLEIL